MDSWSEIPCINNLSAWSTGFPEMWRSVKRRTNSVPSIGPVGLLRCSYEPVSWSGSDRWINSPHSNSIYMINFNIILEFTCRSASQFPFSLHVYWLITYKSADYAICSMAYLEIITWIKRRDVEVAWTVITSRFYCAQCFLQVHENPLHHQNSVPIRTAIFTLCTCANVSLTVPTLVGGLLPNREWWVEGQPVSQVVKECQTGACGPKQAHHHHLFCIFRLHCYFQLNTTWGHVYFSQSLRCKPTVVKISEPLRAQPGLSKRSIQFSGGGGGGWN
jgi:hypothetical protein